MKHGTPNTYRNGCRCEECSTAHRERMYQMFTDLRSRPRSEVPHGTTGGYTNWGCRCALCKQVHTDRCRNYYRRVLSPKTREA